MYTKISFGLFFMVMIGCSPAIKLPKAEKIGSVSTEEQSRKIKRAAALHDQGKHEEAIQQYHEVLTENPDNVAAIYEVAYANFTARNYENAHTEDFGKFNKLPHLSLLRSSL